MPSIGPLELGIVLIIALLVLGPKRLPEAGRGLGRSLREFKSGIAGTAGEIKAGLDGDAADSHEEPGPTVG